MTEQKEIAKELIKKYLPLAISTDQWGVNCINKRLQNAKLCAIEEIKGIKKALEDYTEIITVEAFDTMGVPKAPIYKWEQVEKEIHKI